SWNLPPIGQNPSTEKQGTSPGSFARPPGIGSRWTFASPDAPGMPAPSEKTAWDFLPAEWGRSGERTARPPRGFQPVTQLESARLGIITPEMAAVASRESHLTAEQICAEVAAGRMIIPANKVHL